MMKMIILKSLKRQLNGNKTLYKSNNLNLIFIKRIKLKNNKRIDKSYT
jgi:hypothetical protein